MKKFACLLFAMMLCLSCALAEEFVPSKTTGDLTNFEVAGENIPADATLVVAPVTSDSVEYAERIETCQAEITKLASEEVAVVDYFADVKDAEGNEVSLTEMLETETLNVYEFCPFIVENYEEEYGKVNVTMLFSTPYEAGQKVIVLIGLVSVVDGVQTVEWTAYEGVGIATDAVEEQGCIEVELDPEIMKAVQSGVALLAVVSK